MRPEVPGHKVGTVPEPSRAALPSLHDVASVAVSDFSVLSRREPQEVAGPGAWTRTLPEKASDIGKHVRQFARCAMVVAMVESASTHIAVWLHRHQAASESAEDACSTKMSLFRGFSLAFTSKNP